MKKIVTSLFLLFISLQIFAQFSIATVNTTGASCLVASDGSICFSVSNGIPPYTCNLIANSTSNGYNCINNLFAGTYTITCSDANNATTSSIVTVGYRPSNTKVLVSDTNTCLGDAVTFMAAFSDNGNINIINYCSPNIANNTDEDITNVTVDSLTNASSCSGIGLSNSVAGKYSNYTNLAVTLAPNDFVPFSITIDNCSGTGNNNATAIYIDYNVDGDFTDPGELVYISGSIYIGGHTEIGSFIVPASVKRGVTRMRVMNVSVNSTSAISPCGSYNKGEVEDYTIYINETPTGIYWSGTFGAINDEAISLAVPTTGYVYLTVDYNNGCSNTDSIYFVVQDPPALTIIPSNITCKNATLLTSVVGNGPYNFTWLPNFESTASITGLNNGMYYLTVTDSNGCKAVDSFLFAAALQLNTNITITNVKCKDDSTGALLVVSTGGAPPLNYFWSPNLGTISNPQNLLAGNYIVTTQDANGCTSSAAATITQPATKLQINLTVTNISGYQKDDGSAKVFATGGILPYTYLWAPGGETTDSIGGQKPGNYAITVKDANGCPAVQSFKFSDAPDVVQQVDIKNLIIAPNPATTKIVVKADDVVENIKIYNSVGAIVYHKSKINTLEYVINVEDFPIGIYTIVLNNKVAQKLSIQ